MTSITLLTSHVALRMREYTANHDALELPAQASSFKVNSFLIRDSMDSPQSKSDESSVPHWA